MLIARPGELTFRPIVWGLDPSLVAVLADLRPGQLREMQASQPGMSAAELAADLRGLLASGRRHALTLIEEGCAPRALLIRVDLDHRAVALAMVATRAWEGRIPAGLYRWFARVFLPGLDREDVSAAVVEVIRFADTPPRAHDWLRRLGFTVARTTHLRAACADRVTFRRLHPRLRSTPAKKAS